MFWPCERGTRLFDMEGLGLVWCFLLRGNWVLEGCLLMSVCVWPKFKRQILQQCYNYLHKSGSWDKLIALGQQSKTVFNLLPVGISGFKAVGI